MTHFSNSKSRIFKLEDAQNDHSLLSRQIINDFPCFVNHLRSIIVNICSFLCCLVFSSEFYWGLTVYKKLQISLSSYRAWDAESEETIKWSQLSPSHSWDTIGPNTEAEERGNAEDHHPVGSWSLLGSFENLWMHNTEAFCKSLLSHFHHRRSKAQFLYSYLVHQPLPESALFEAW